jgi:glycosyltransferase involved in cell wall biosynthesis
MPYSLGGKEVYCGQMAVKLHQEGHQNHIIIHQPNTALKPIETHLAYKLHVLSPLQLFNKSLNWYNLRVNQDDFLADFVEKLKEIKPDKVVFHDQNGGASLSHLRMVKKYTTAMVSIVFHSPGQMCVNRLLLKNKTEFCITGLALNTCTNCKLVSLPGRANLFFKLLNKLPAFIWKAKHPQALVQHYISGVKEFYQNADQIYYHANWVKDLLLTNGVAKEKFTFLPLEEVLGFDLQPSSPKAVENRSYKIVLLGRPTYIKGFHLAINALLALPKNLNFEVHLLGKAWNETEYSLKLWNSIKEDTRFVKPIEIPNQEMNVYLSQFDLCIVPSVWPETGPISVLDALNAGVSVLGADLAGIREQSNKYGFKTFNWNDQEDLRKQLFEILTSHHS